MISRIIAKREEFVNVSEHWDSVFTVPQFDFYFKVVLPKARKEREIIQRDYLGRIVASKVPEYSNYYAEQ